VQAFTVSTVISAPREEVFEFVGDLAYRVSFADHYMKDFRLERTRSTGQGAAARFRTDAPFAGGWVELRVVESDAPRRIVERGDTGRLGRTEVAAVYEFLAEGQGVTRVELTVWTEPGTRLDSLKESLGARRWLKRQSKVALERLRMVFEERPEGPLARVTVAGYESWKAPRYGSPRPRTASPQAVGHPPPD